MIRALLLAVVVLWSSMLIFLSPDTGVAATSCSTPGLPFATIMTPFLRVHARPHDDSPYSAKFDRMESVWIAEERVLRQAKKTRRQRRYYADRLWVLVCGRNGASGWTTMLGAVWPRCAESSRHCHQLLPIGLDSISLTQVAPEPSSALLLLGGVAALALRRHRRTCRLLARRI